MRNFSASFIPAALVLVFAIFAGLIIYRAAWFGIDKHFSLLAASFIQGDLFLNPNNLPDGDYVDYRGKQYLFFGPMPSVLLMPPVMIWGKNFPQMALSIGSLVITYFSVFLISRKLKFTRIDSLWLANFFVFGTVLYFVSLINISAYIVQAVGTAFFFLSLVEYFTKRRWLVIGMLVAAAGATRITLFGLAVFYILEIIRLRHGQDFNFKRAFILLIIPIIFSASLLGLYNFRRFHSFFDTGYTRNVSVLDKNYLNNKLGYFSPVHIPANLYIMFFAPPEPLKRDSVEFVLKFPYLKANPFGMAILFTSPLFIYLVRTRKEGYVSSAILGIIVLALPSLTYFGIGFTQFGYRYSLDFLPLVFLILLAALRGKITGVAQILITLGVVFNSLYMSSIWNSYPLLTIFDYIF